MSIDKPDNTNSNRDKSNEKFSQIDAKDFRLGRWNRSFKWLIAQKETTDTIKSRCRSNAEYKEDEIYF